MTRAVPLAPTVAAATSWAAAALLAKVALRELAPLDVLGVELFSSAIAMVCLAGARGRSLLPPNRRAFAALGVIGPGLAFALIDFGFARTGAPTAPSSIASQSLFGVVLARSSTCRFRAFRSVWLPATGGRPRASCPSEAII